VENPLKDAGGKKIPLMDCSGAEELRANTIAVSRIGSAQQLRSCPNLVSKDGVDQRMIVAHHESMNTLRFGTCCHRASKFP
jgi:hypothetical protein